MKLSTYNTFCAALLATTHVVQWGGSHVWKVGGKVFAIAHDETGTFACSFKVSDLSFEVLQALPGLRPAPYLASRGLKWIQHYTKPGLPDKDLKQYLRISHQIVAAGLSRKKRLELGLESA